MTKRSKELSTVAKREAIASELSKIATLCGATVDREEVDREINLVLRLGHHWVAISLDGDSTWGILGHWNIDGRRWISDTGLFGWDEPGHWEEQYAPRFPGNFGFTVRGSVNEWHYSKATTCPNTLLQLYEAIGAGLSECARLAGPSRPRVEATQ